MTADTLSLAGKVAIVTGSARENGIGAGIAFALARNGAAVTINYVSDASAPRGEAVAKNIRDAGGRAISVKASVDNVDDGKRLIAETLKAFDTKQIDILGTCN
jgi:NAD(P)-dependent dehydrogenase (short-subunit alcohol dehydrogenase family)